MPYSSTYPHFTHFKGLNSRFCCLVNVQASVPYKNKQCSITCTGGTDLRLGHRFCQHLNAVSNVTLTPVAQHFKQQEHRKKWYVSYTHLHSCPWDKALEQQPVFQVSTVPGSTPCSAFTELLLSIDYTVLLLSLSLIFINFLVLISHWYNNAKSL